MYLLVFQSGECLGATLHVTLVRFLLGVDSEVSVQLVLGVEWFVSSVTIL